MWKTLCEIWDDKSFGKALNRKTRTLGAWIEQTMVAPQPQQQPQPQMGSVYGQVPSSFDSGYGDWNREVNEIECRDV